MDNKLKSYMYTTTYGATFNGRQARPQTTPGRNYIQTVRAPLVPQQAFTPTDFSQTQPAAVAAISTQPLDWRSSQQLRAATPDIPSYRQFKQKKGNFPPPAPIPDKDKFFPIGHRISYAKGRKTFKRTAQIIPPPKTEIRINLPRPTSADQIKIDNYGKKSISTRLPECYQRRYHLPGYMGFVQDIQFKHGRSYGSTTRECIMKDWLSAYP